MEHVREVFEELLTAAGITKVMIFSGVAAVFMWLLGMVRDRVGRKETAKLAAQAQQDRQRHEGELVAQREQHERWKAEWDAALARDRLAHERQLELMRKEQQVELRRIQVALDGVSLVGRARFEKEFVLCQQAWSAMAELRDAALALRPFLTLQSANSTPEELAVREQERRVHVDLRFVDSSNALFKVVHAQEPFYDVDVFNAIMAVVAAARSEHLEFRLNDDRAKERLVRQREISDLADKACVVIRQRIEAMGRIGALPNAPETAVRP